MKPTPWKMSHGWGLWMVRRGGSVVSMFKKKTTAIKDAKKLCRSGSGAAVEFFDDGYTYFSCKGRKRR